MRGSQFNIPFPARISFTDMFLFNTVSDFLIRKNFESITLFILHPGAVDSRLKAKLPSLNLFR
jgi:hypothetical protein